MCNTAGQDAETLQLLRLLEFGLHVPPLSLGASALGNILHEALKVHGAVGGLHTAYVHQDPHGAAVLAIHLGLKIAGFTVLFQQVQQFHAPLRLHIRFRNGRHLRQQCRRRLEAGHLCQCRIGSEQTPLRGGLENAFQGLLKDPAVFGLSLAQGFSLPGVFERNGSLSREGM